MSTSFINIFLGILAIYVPIIMVLCGVAFNKPDFFKKNLSGLLMRMQYYALAFCVGVFCICFQIDKPISDGLMFGVVEALFIFGAFFTANVLTHWVHIQKLDYESSTHK